MMHFFTKSIILNNNKIQKCETSKENPRTETTSSCSERVPCCQKSEKLIQSMAHFKLLLVALLYFGWTYLAIVLLLINITLGWFGKKLFAGFCSNFASKYGHVSHPMKTELFKDLLELKKARILTSKKAIR